MGGPGRNACLSRRAAGDEPVNMRRIPTTPRGMRRSTATCRNRMLRAPSEGACRVPILLLRRAHRAGLCARGHGQRHLGQRPRPQMPRCGRAVALPVGAVRIDTAHGMGTRVPTRSTGSRRRRDVHTGSAHAAQRGHPTQAGSHGSAPRQRIADRRGDLDASRCRRLRACEEGARSDVCQARPEAGLRDEPKTGRPRQCGLSLKAQLRPCARTGRRPARPRAPGNGRSTWRSPAAAAGLSAWPASRPA